MLYQIIDWDQRTGIARGFPASIPFNNVQNIDIVDLYSNLPLNCNFTYSFNPQHKFVQEILTIGELDYKNPVPTGVKKNAYR